MKRLYFDYYMQIDYTEVVSTCNFTIKCIPKDTLRQKIENIRIELYPESEYCEGTDGLGNLQIYGRNGISHDKFFCHIIGVATTGLYAYEEDAEESKSMIFRHPYGMNVAGATIRQFYESIKDDLTGEAYADAVEIRNRLHQYFIYRKDCTCVTTTAEEAFEQGCGVCQDYSHIYIALLHLAGIPARYVTGFILGEGASHAWVEILYNGKWFGQDPTNNETVGDNYIKIGVGRDAGDCMINRGIMHGGGYHTQQIKVNVFEIQGVNS